MLEETTSTSGSVPQIDLDSLFGSFYLLLKRVFEGDELVNMAYWLWDAINYISIFLVPVLFFGIIYIAIRTKQMHKEEHEQFREETVRVRGENKGDMRWKRIVGLVASDNPTEWRHGVIEADVLLDEVLTEKGYVGDTLGEKLKNISRDSLRSLNAAWEAHKVRNEIAHSGSDFILTQREARRAIDNYRQVFDELGVL